MIQYRHTKIAAAAVFAVAAFVWPANAALVGTYLLETDAVFDGTFGDGNHNLSQDLILSTGGPGNSAAGARDIAEAENEALIVLGADVFADVDQLIVYEVDTNSFELGEGNGIFTIGAISINKISDFVIEWTLVENADIWNIVKVGVKASQESAFFLVDPFAGRDSGTIDIAALVGLYVELDGSIPPGGGPGSAGVFTNKQGIVQAISNITFFGQISDIPEPGALALLGIGLVGLGLLGRRRRAA